MKKLASILCVVAAFVLTYVAWPQEQVDAASRGGKAPNLDISVLSGKPVDLQKSLGKNVTIVEFWATWCTPCRHSATLLSSLQKKYANQGLVVVGISDEDRAIVEAFMKEADFKMNYTVAVDRDHNTTAKYRAAFNVDSIPYAFLVDKSGHIAWHGNPVLPSLEKTLVALFQEDAQSSRNARLGSTRSRSKTRTNPTSWPSSSGSDSK